MKIAVDAQLALGTATGIGEYVRGLIDALKGAGVDVLELSEPTLDPWRFDRRVVWDQVWLPQRARRSGADLLHCASGTAPITMSMPTVVTVHDVAYLRVQDHAPVYARYYFGKFAIERYKRAAAIAVDSAFSRGELLEAVPQLDAEKVRVVYPGVAQDFLSLERKGSDGRTILVVGTVERRKNLMAMIEALPEMPNARIVSVGPFTPYQEDCVVRAHALGVYDRVEFRGYVERADVLELYATCAVVAMPSRYEGFGYAAAQGLCAGAPVIVSDQASLPEIVQCDAVIVPVDDAAGWVDALRSALSGDRNTAAMNARERSRERFAWAKSARAMKQLYNWSH